MTRLTRWLVASAAVIVVALPYPAGASASVARLFSTLPRVKRTSMPSRPDPLAPVGAEPVWLPNIRWVMERWQPFDSADLLNDLDLNSASDQSWLFFWFNDGHTLDELARRFGTNPNRLQARLLDQRQASYRPRLRAVLAHRVRLMFTQPHLAQHVLFHWFHDWAMSFDTMPIYGLPYRTVWLLEHGIAHETRLQVAQSQGITYPQLRERVLAAEWRLAEQGVRRGALSQAQARWRQAQLVHSVRVYLTEKLMAM